MIASAAINWRTTLCGLVGLVAALPTLGVALPASLAAAAAVAGAVALPLGHILAADGRKKDKPDGLR